jgi:hypothetical protein
MDIDIMHTLGYKWYIMVEKKQYDFSIGKNQQLIKERGISFEEVIAAIREGAVLDVLPHPNSDKYPHQEMYLLNMSGYVFVVPFVRKDKNTVFLKTIFPHRKLTKQYLGGAVV